MAQHSFTFDLSYILTFLIHHHVQAGVTYYVLLGTWGSGDVPGNGTLNVLRATSAPTLPPTLTPGQTNAPTLIPVRPSSCSPGFDNEYAYMNTI